MSSGIGLVILSFFAAGFIAFIGYQLIKIERQIKKKKEREEECVE